MSLKHFIPDFRGLVYEASEREYWAEDDFRWGKVSTTWTGFWLLALGGRLWNALCGYSRWMIPCSEKTSLPSLHPTYAFAGLTPFDWHRWEVRDLDTGDVVPDVVEVDTMEGWARVYVKNPDGSPSYYGEELYTKTLIGRFELFRQPKDG